MDRTYENSDFMSEFSENRTSEQYFWTSNMVQKLLKALNLDINICCLATPSLALMLNESGNTNQFLLDCDERFSFLPNYVKFDFLKPKGLEQSFDVIVCDPPFFQIPLEKIENSIEILAKKNFQTKVLVTFLKREEMNLMRVFEKFELRPTKFSVEYARVDAGKWKNYGLYSNFDFPGIKRIF